MTTSPWPDAPPTAAHKAAYADAKPVPYWLDALPQREPYPPLTGTTNADLCIVGGGFTGLWAALHAKRDDPWRDVVLLEQDTIGIGASGRNGGFVISSLTHGITNGLSRFEEEMPELERLADENFEGLKRDLATHGIDCDFEETGDLLVFL
ncbi:MAG TPA: FAD-dependent oxidoreductase, partial [Thermoleophilaceae bacterium]